MTTEMSLAIVYYRFSLMISRATSVATATTTAPITFPNIRFTSYFCIDWITELFKSPNPMVCN